MSSVVDEIFGSISYWFEIGIAISSVIGGVMAGIAYMKRRIRREERKAVEEASIDGQNSSFQSKHTVVHETLTTLRIRSGADRARIGSFHNGGKFLDGSPMKKFSITHESCEVGVSYDGWHFQNILVTMFWDLVEGLRQDSSVLRWSRDMKAGYFRSYINTHGVVGYSVLPIRKGHLLIGFILLEWFDAERTPTLDGTFDKLFTQARDYIEFELALK